MSIDLTIFGTRGSLPCTAKGCERFGGATSCYHLDLGARHLIFDAGSGIVELGQHLMAKAPHAPIDLFFSHFHYDHVMGLPFFQPLYQRGWPIRLWTNALFGSGGIDLALDCLFSEPLCPVTRDLLVADISIHDLPNGSGTDVTPDVHLTTTGLAHPGGNAAYKVVHGGQAFVYSGDFEHGDAQSDATLRQFLDGVDLAFLDCTYTPDSYEACRGFGHAHWMAAGEIAEAAGVGAWYGVHHEHTLNDAALDVVDHALQARFKTGALAQKGMTFTLGA